MNTPLKSAVIITAATALFSLASPAFAAPQSSCEFAPASVSAAATQKADLKPWTQAADLPSTGFSLAPDVKQLSDGRLMSVWRTGDGDVPWRIHAAYSSDKAKTWSQPVTLVNSPFDESSEFGDLFQPVVQTSGDRVVVSFSSTDPAKKAWTMGAVVSDDNGATWSAPVALSQPMLNDAVNEVPVSTVQQDGTVTVGWRMWDQDAGTFHPQLRQLKPGASTWGPAIDLYLPAGEDDQAAALALEPTADGGLTASWARLATEGEGGTVQAAKLALGATTFSAATDFGFTKVPPKLASDNRGNVVLVYVDMTEGEEQQLMVTRSSEGSTSWSKPERICEWSDSAGFPTVTSTPNGEIQIYQLATDPDGRTVVRQTVGTATGSFGTYREIGTVDGGSDALQLTTEKDGNITLAWNGCAEDGTSLGLRSLTSTDDGQTWSAVTEIDNDTIGTTVNDVRLVETKAGPVMSWTQSAAPDARLHNGDDRPSAGSLKQDCFKVTSDDGTRLRVAVRS